jgi:exonuclease SbcC
VSAVVHLADRRRVELRQDLADGVDCRATDDLGRDISDEIMHEGAPDAARWVGLDRRSFLRRACVRQAEIAAVVEHPAELQEVIQRAAATTEARATAAAAIRLIEEFRSKEVGLDRANSTRPLRAAREALDEARRRQRDAERQHREYLRLQGELEALAESAETARRALRLAEAKAARDVALAVQSDLERARQLAGRFPDGEPADEVQDDARAAEVAAALDAWERRPPAPSDLAGPTSEEMQREINALPPLPAGDLTPERSVQVAWLGHRDARRDLEQHRSRRPLPAPEVESGGLSVAELRELAGELERAEMLTVASPVGAHPGGRVRLPWFVPALAAAVVGGALLPQQTILGVALLVLSAGLLVAATRSASRSSSPPAADVSPPANAARERAIARGLPVEPVTLRALADDVHAAERARAELDEWEREQQAYGGVVEEAEHRLGSALEGRGLTLQGGESLDAAFERYQAECREREAVGQRAARRPELERQLQARRQAEQAHAGIEQQRASAADRLRRAAVAVGVRTEAEEDLAAGLRRWRQERVARLEALKRVRQEWSEMQVLLDGRTLDELAAEAGRVTEQAKIRAGAFTRAEVEQADATSIEALHDAARAGDERLYTARGDLERFISTMPDPAEAEEQLRAAEAELQRVEDLARILDVTRQFLARAQERAHGNIAPVLREALVKRLPSVTGGRYTDARVDPESLSVQIRSEAGAWRVAADLSHGTAEQVYLLLRVALVQHLTKNGEPCPLILDDATVQSDGHRTQMILDALYEISRERQVIVFSQEPEVLAWARTKLAAEGDLFMELEVLPAM